MIGPSLLTLIHQASDSCEMPVTHISPIEAVRHRTWCIKLPRSVRPGDTAILEREGAVPLRRTLPTYIYIYMKSNTRLIFAQKT